MSKDNNQPRVESESHTPDGKTKIIHYSDGTHFLVAVPALQEWTQSLLRLGAACDAMTDKYKHIYDSLTDEDRQALFLWSPGDEGDEGNE